MEFYILCLTIFFVRWKVKKLSTGRAGGNGGTVPIMSWKCNFSIYLDIQVYYLDIQAITTLYASIGFLCVSFFYSLIFLPYNRSPESDISSTQKASPFTVFNLQVSNWVHCEKETRAYCQL